MDIQPTSYDHGWNACRVCHRGRTQTRHDRWTLTANPGYWGATNPTVLVLGFSKGANQVGAIERLPFDEVAFKGRRPTLQRILRRLGVRFDNQSIDQSMTAHGRGFGYASLIRCSIAQDKNGTPVTSGTIVTDAVADPWARGVMRECVRQHLGPMPPSVKRVVLLSNDARYVAGVRALIREQFDDFRDINPMGFEAGGRRWIFTVHPAAKGAHVPTWLDGPDDVGQGLKREQAIEAFGTLEEVPTRGSSIGKKRLIKAVLA